jgi:AcrR family transcriptional regulator
MATARALRWERRPDERPQELLDAALAVFAERGYRNARIDDVAEAAGVTKGAVYHHFANKEQLLSRAIEHYLAKAFGNLDALLRGEGGPASVRIRLLLRRGFGSSDPNRRRVLALLLQDLRHDVPRAYRQWLAGGPMKGWQLLTDLIEDGKTNGEFRPDVVAESAARVTIAGLMAQLVWQGLAAEVPGLAIDEDRLVDSTVDLLLHSLRPVLVVAG